jgi:hypothetical protein
VVDFVPDIAKFAGQVHSDGTAVEFLFNDFHWSVASAFEAGWGDEEWEMSLGE